MTEPGGRTAVGGYGQFLSLGYADFKSTDGKAFLLGAYQVKYQAQTLDGQAVAYTASVSVGAPQPNNPTAASFAAAGKGLFDSLEPVAIVTNQDGTSPPGPVRRLRRLGAQSLRNRLSEVLRKGYSTSRKASDQRAGASRDTAARACRRGRCGRPGPERCATPSAGRTMSPPTSP